MTKEELLTQLQDNPAYIEGLLSDKTYVGEIIGEPFLGPTTIGLIPPSYELHIRSLNHNPHVGITHEIAELILETGEILPVTIIGSSHINPTPQAWQTGFWTVWDHYHSIKNADLTEEQVLLARWFVQRERVLPHTTKSISFPTDEALWHQEVRIKYKVLQEAEALKMTSAHFDHLVDQRHTYIRELKQLYGDNIPDDLKPYLEDPPKPPNLRP
jgi:hypothetical protein